jgi:subtilisin family serine protease
LPNVLIVKVKESYRGYFYKGEVSDTKLESVFNGCGVQSIVRKFPNCLKPRTKKNKDGITHPDLSLIYQIEYTKDIDPRKLVKVFMQSGAFYYVEPSFFFEPLYKPNDSEIDSLYFLDLLNLYSAWDSNKGDTNVVIGISDTGFDIDHPDLINSVKYNYADPINGLDDY